MAQGTGLFDICLAHDETQAGHNRAVYHRSASAANRK